MDQATRRDRIVPAPVRRQGDAGARAARVDPVLLPDVAARGGAALVSRRHRRLHRHLDGRRPRPRAERLRRDGLPRRWSRDGTPFYDPLGLVSEGTKIDFQLRGQLVSVWHAVHDVAGAPLLARAAGRVGRAQRGQPRVLRRAVPAGLRRRHRTRRGRAGSRTSTRSSRRTSRRSASTR